MTAAAKIAESRALIKPLTGHTPGPWVKRTGMHSAWVEQEDGAERFSCTVVGGDGQGGAMDNARLIAAAPALRDTVAALADLAEAQAQEIGRLVQIIARMDAVTPRADESCDDPGITLSEAIQRKWPHLRVSTGDTQ